MAAVGAEDGGLNPCDLAQDKSPAKGCGHEVHFSGLGSLLDLLVREKHHAQAKTSLLE